MLKHTHMHAHMHARMCTHTCTHTHIYLPVLLSLCPSLSLMHTHSLSLPLLSPPPLLPYALLFSLSLWAIMRQLKHSGSINAHISCGVWILRKSCWQGRRVITEKIQHYLLGGKFKVISNNPLTKFCFTKMGLTACTALTWKDQPCWCPFPHAPWILSWTPPDSGATRGSYCPWSLVWAAGCWLHPQCWCPWQHHGQGGGTWSNGWSQGCNWGTPQIV